MLTTCIQLCQNATNVCKTKPGVSEERVYPERKLENINYLNKIGLDVFKRFPTFTLSLSAELFPERCMCRYTKKTSAFANG